MPNPLILLENHDCSAAKDFIIENIAALKALGYKKVLLEVSKEHTAESLKKQLEEVCIKASNNPNDRALAKMKYDAEPKLAMLKALEKEGIPYEFIDPQSEKELENLMLEAFQKYQSGDYKSDAEMHKGLQTIVAEKAKLRDVDLSVTFIKEAIENDDGVIHLGGFMHKDLVKFLQNDSSKYRYLILNNSSQNYRVNPEKNAQQIWLKLFDDNFRKEFYGAQVNYFDLATRPSFARIVNECRLTKFAEPVLGKYLKESTQLNYDFDIDEDYVLSATTEIDNDNAEKVINQMRDNFIGLNFFTEQKSTTTKIRIPGINLEENRLSLKLGFYKQGVMQYLDDESAIDSEEEADLNSVSIKSSS